VDPGFLDIGNENEYLCGMFIRAVQKHKAGTNEKPMYFRMYESYRDSPGNPRQRTRRADTQELCRCLNDMLLPDQRLMCDNPYIIELAGHYYQKTVDSNRTAPVSETETASRKDAEYRKQEEIAVKLSTLTNVYLRERSELNM
jgi:hypothetical protein